MFRTLLPILDNRSAPDPTFSLFATSPTAEEVQAMTFSQWFMHWWSLPSSAASRGYLYSDKQYWLLHRAVHTGIKPTSIPDIDEPARRWIYTKRSTHNYRVVMMYYDRPSQSTSAVVHSSGEQRQLGRVLVTFPKDTEAAEELSQEDMRRVISYSQIEEALTHCHLGGTGHRGMDAVETMVKDHYCGISRLLIREFIDRCGVCQSKKRQQYSAPLKSIISRTRFERLIMDLIDNNSKPDGDYHYIFHIGDHVTKYRWAKPIVNKEAATVAAELNTFFTLMGPSTLLQCDNGKEFKGEVEVLCAAWGVKLLNSSPYHPQTNGFIERANATLKMMIAKWQNANNTRRWAESVERLTYQINTTWTRTVDGSPFELMFGVRPPVDCVPVCDVDYLSEILNAPVIDLTRSPPLSSITGPAVAVTGPAVKTERLPAIDLTAVVTHQSSPAAIHPSPSAATDHSSSSASPQSSSSGTHQSLASHTEQKEGRDDLMTDLSFRETAPLGTLAARIFNVGHQFRRYGCLSRGRCCISAVELAMTNCVGAISEKELEDLCDAKREKMRDMVEGWTEKERDWWTQLMLDLNPAREEVSDHPPYPPVKDIRRSILNGLEVDLDCQLAECGWDYLVCVHAMYNVNIIVIPIVNQRNTRERYEGDQDPIVEQTELCAISITRIPYQCNPHHPFIVIYQKSEFDVFCPAAGREHCAYSSTGHFEVVYWKHRTTGAMTSFFPTLPPCLSSLTTSLPQ